MVGLRGPTATISAISGCRMRAEGRLPISKLLPPPAPPLDLQPLPLSALGDKEFKALHSLAIKM